MTSMDMILECIYKPDRALYYIVPDEKQKADFYKGIIPEELMAFNGTFGTYDFPGLFILDCNGTMKEVLGIEFRPYDSRIQYPQGMSYRLLKHSFLVSALFTHEEYLDESEIKERIDYVQKNVRNNSYNIFRNVVEPAPRPEVIQIFTMNKRNRFGIQAKEIDMESFFMKTEPVTEKEKYFFRTAYKDFITDHYNWNYIWPIIAGFGFKGLQDFTFVHFDVKDFKAVNVVYGHKVGNELLRKIASHMKEKDWIFYSARCDNDNFAMMIKDMPEQETKQKLLDFFGEISVLDDDPRYHIYYRCGVVPMRNTLKLGDRVADAGKQIQRVADRLYETEIVFYTDKMHDELTWSLQVKAYLDTAIEKDEFLVYLQPKYDIKTENLHGAEALIRWKYHGKELLGPGRFVPILEEGGLINKLDDIVLKKICMCFVDWKKKNLPLLPISVNLSRKQLGDPNLVEHLTAIVDSYGVDHSLIDFELTESAAYDNQAYLVKVIKGLKEKGFRISMDDFGTGYSSLSLLTAIPMDTIKIDKSFVNDLDSAGEDSSECIVMKHIISMVKDLKLTCLAEGAENKAQVDALRDFGCDVVQGYYYSKPLPVETYEEKLKE